MSYETSVMMKTLNNGIVSWANSIKNKIMLN